MKMLTPFNFGDTVYKICPKCNEQHQHTCEHCAWRGTHAHGCDIGVRIWEDGSFNKHELQIIPVSVDEHNFFTIVDCWNIDYFANEKDALTAMAEYDAIRKIDDRKARYERFEEWADRREAAVACYKSQDT